MKQKIFTLKLLLVANTFFAFNSNAQISLFKEDFLNIPTPDVVDNYSSFGDLPNTWRQYDVDNNPYLTSTYSPYMTGYGSRVLNNSVEKCALLWARHGTNTPSNDWLVTPQINIPNTGDSVNLLVKIKEHQYHSTTDTLRVLVSTTGNTLNSTWTEIASYSAISAVSIYGDLYTINLDSYRGQNIYIAFNSLTKSTYNSHCVEIVEVEAEQHKTETKLKNYGLT